MNTYASAKDTLFEKDFWPENIEYKLDITDLLPKLFALTRKYPDRTDLIVDYVSNQLASTKSSNENSNTDSSNKSEPLVVTREDHEKSKLAHKVMPQYFVEKTLHGEDLSLWSKTVSSLFSISGVKTFDKRELVILSSFPVIFSRQLEWDDLIETITGKDVKITKPLKETKRLKFIKYNPDKSTKHTKNRLLALFYDDQNFLYNIDLGENTDQNRSVWDFLLSYETEIAFTGKIGVKTTFCGNQYINVARATPVQRDKS